MGQTCGFLRGPPEPFQAAALDGAGGLTDSPGEKIERGADAEGDAEIGLGFRQTTHECFLFGGAKSHPDEVGFGAANGIERKIFDVVYLRRAM